MQRGENYYGLYPLHMRTTACPKKIVPSFQKIIIIGAKNNFGRKRYNLFLTHCIKIATTSRRLLISVKNIQIDVWRCFFLKKKRSMGTSACMQQWDIIHCFRLWYYSVIWPLSLSETSCAHFLRLGRVANSLYGTLEQLQRTNSFIRMALGYQQLLGNITVGFRTILCSLLSRELNWAFVLESWFCCLAYIIFFILVVHVEAFQVSTYSLMI